MATILKFPDVVIPHGPRSLDPAVELRTIRAQAAVIRSLLDELDLLTAPEGASALATEVAAQTVEEMTTLAWRMLHAAAALTPHRVPQATPPLPDAPAEGKPQRIAG